MKETRSMFEINGKTYNAKPIPGECGGGRYNIYRMLAENEKPRNHWGDKEGKILITEISLNHAADSFREVKYSSPKESFIDKIAFIPRLASI